MERFWLNLEKGSTLDELDSIEIPGLGHVEPIVEAVMVGVGKRYHQIAVLLLRLKQEQ